MALFKRATLKEWGMTDEQIEKVMTESGRALNDYELKTSVQAKIDEAVKNAQPDPVNVQETAEYMALFAENEKLKAFNTEDFSVVKAPYKDMVWDKLDHGAEHKPYTEQLNALSETLPDLFTSADTAQKINQIGGEAGGTMPKGNEAPSFSNLWGFVPNK